MGSGGAFGVSGDPLGAEAIGCSPGAPVNKGVGVMMDAVNWPPGVMTGGVAIAAATGLVVGVAGGVAIDALGVDALVGSAATLAGLLLITAVCVTIDDEAMGPAA